MPEIDPVAAFCNGIVSKNNPDYHTHLPAEKMCTAEDWFATLGNILRVSGGRGVVPYDNPRSCTLGYIFKDVCYNLPQREVMRAKPEDMGQIPDLSVPRVREALGHTHLREALYTGRLMEHDYILYPSIPQEGLDSATFDWMGWYGDSPPKKAFSEWDQTLLKRLGFTPSQDFPLAFEVVVDPHRVKQGLVDSTVDQIRVVMFRLGDHTLRAEFDYLTKGGDLSGSPRIFLGQVTSRNSVDLQLCELERTACIRIPSTPALSPPPPSSEPSYTADEDLDVTMSVGRLPFSLRWSGGLSPRASHTAAEDQILWNLIKEQAVDEGSPNDDWALNAEDLADVAGSEAEEGSTVPALPFRVMSLMVDGHVFSVPASAFVHQVDFNAEAADHPVAMTCFLQK